MAKDTRLQKMLAECGIASRRKAEEMIAAGRVAVNGVRAQIGDKVDVKKDKVTVDGQRVQTVDEPRHGRYCRLLRAFKARTGCGVIENTHYIVQTAQKGSI